MTPIPTCLRLAAFLTVLTLAAPAQAQTPAQSMPQEPVPPTPGEPTPLPLQPGDAFGQEVVLPSRTIIYVQGQSGWPGAYAALQAAFKRLRVYTDKKAIQPTGPALVIYTASAGQGFSFRAALPVEAAPKDEPPAGILIGAAPSGRALKFAHRGAFDALGTTYEAITEFLDEKNLDATEPFIEEYVSDPLQTVADKLIVNVYVPVK